VGHLQVVTGLSDQLYRSAWGILGEFWGRGAVRDLIITVGAMAPGFSVGTTLMYLYYTTSIRIIPTLGNKGTTKLLMIVHLKNPGPWHPLL